MPERPRPAPRTLAVLWTLAMLVGLSLPGEDIPSLEGVGFDKLVHAAGFFGFGLLWLLASPRVRWRILALGLLFAVGSEFYQLIPQLHRDFSPFDALADAVGLGIGLLVGVRWQRGRAAALRRGGGPSNFPEARGSRGRAHERGSPLR